VTNAAESAAPRAQVAEQHEGGRAASPALAAVGAAGLLAHRVKPVPPERLLDAQELPARWNLHAYPAGKLSCQGRSPLYLPSISGDDGLPGRSEVAAPCYVPIFSFQKAKLFEKSCYSISEFLIIPRAHQGDFRNFEKTRSTSRNLQTKFEDLLKSKSFYPKMMGISGGMKKYTSLLSSTVMPSPITLMIALKV
jgi:hypothetical protein